MEDSDGSFDWGFLIVVQEEEKIDLVIGKGVADGSSILEFALGNLFHEFDILDYSDNINLTVGLLGNNAPNP